MLSLNVIVVVTLKEGTPCIILDFFIRSTNTGDIDIVPRDIGLGCGMFHKHTFRASLLCNVKRLLSLE